MSVNISSITLGSALVLLVAVSACGSGGAESPVASPPTPPVAPSPEPQVDHSGLPPLSPTQADTNEYLAGGDATVFRRDNDAFSTRPRAIAQNFVLDGHFTSGDHIFRTPHEGAGPLLNTSNCQGCHLNDGRGVLPVDTQAPFTSALVKIGDSQGQPDPIYGDQLQTFAEQSFSSADFESGWPQHNGSVNGDQLFGEAFTFIEYETIEGQYADGSSYNLRRPIVKTRSLSFGEFGSDIYFSTRLAPQVFGVGLLDAIPAANILALADANDSNGDGVSGRASMVEDRFSGETRLGRFAYKAQNPSVLQQVTAAYAGDIGITNSLFSQEPCTDLQIACLAAAEREQQVGKNLDITDLELALVEFYTRTLGVPARRGFDPDNQVWSTEVQTGRTRFFDAGCDTCHTPRHLTGQADGSVLGEISFSQLSPDAAPIEMLSNQEIYPYTDLLLHDMGGSCSVSRETAQQQSCTSGAECLYVQRCEGLADGLTQGMAGPSEWKTPPLWGIGLVQTVNSNSTFLHDGRARTIEEAILWHGGEAETSLNAFKQMNAEQRANLLAFVESL